MFFWFVYMFNSEAQRLEGCALFWLVIFFFFFFFIFARTYTNKINYFIFASGMLSWFYSGFTGTFLFLFFSNRPYVFSGYSSTSKFYYISSSCCWWAFGCSAWVFLLNQKG